jgi:aspartate racemase
MKTNSKKAIGIIGGMGPAATASLFSRIIALTPAESDQGHLRVLIDNNPEIPDRTAAILGRGENPVGDLLNSANGLIRAGADFIIIPCVTAHYYYEHLAKAINFPIMNLINEMVEEVKTAHSNLTRVGLMATTGTIRGRIFDSKLEQEGLSLIRPNESMQDNLMEAIYGPYGVKRGFIDGRSKQLLLNISSSLRESGAEILFAACTEISLALGQESLPIPLLDSLEVLARRAVEFALGSTDVSCRKMERIATGNRKLAHE